MTKQPPLDADEELLWRSLLRLTILLPRLLDEDLLAGSGLSLTEYAALMNLSEAPRRQLRMTELATATALSASRITRLVAGLQQQGLVTRERCAADARGTTATLTSQGLARLKAAYPCHLASARHRVLSHLGPRQVATTAAALHAVVAAGDR